MQRRREFRKKSETEDKLNRDVAFIFREMKRERESEGGEREGEEYEMQLIKKKNLERTTQIEEGKEKPVKHSSE